MQSISLLNVSSAQKMHPSEVSTNKVGLVQSGQHQVPAPVVLDSKDVKWCGCRRWQRTKVCRGSRAW